MSKCDGHPPEFDLEKVYDEQISPLMAQIIEICQQHKIPMVASFQYATEENCSTVLLYKERETSPMLRRMALLLKGLKQPGVRVTMMDHNGNPVSQEIILDPLPGEGN
jgi:hypothetical protein